MECTFSHDTPDRLKLINGLHLLTEATPNGRRVQILLEELREAYNLQCTVHLVDLETDEQKKAWFLRLNPNGRIPVLIQKQDERVVSVFESAAILQYLAQQFDQDFRFSFESVDEASMALQWLFFWHSNTPIHSLARYLVSSKEDAPALRAKSRSDMLERYTTLEAHLSGRYSGQARNFLAGNGVGMYSIADIGAWPHVKSYKTLGFTDEDMNAFPCLLAWIDAISTRAAVERGISDMYDSEEHPDMTITSE